MNLDRPTKNALKNMLKGGNMLITINYYNKNLYVLAKLQNLSINKITFKDD